MSTVRYTWLHNNRNKAEECRVCKENLVFPITDTNDEETVATLNATLIRALGSSTSKGRRFCRHCTLRLLTLKQHFEEFEFARRTLDFCIEELRATLSAKDPIPVTLTSIADSTVQDDQQNSGNNKMDTSSVTAASIDIVSGLEKHNVEPGQDESAKVNTPSACTSEAPSPVVRKIAEKIVKSPLLINIAVSEPGETDAATSSKSSDDVIVEATQPMSKNFENSDLLSQANSKTVSSPSSTKVKSQEDVDKIVKAAESSDSDEASEESKGKKDAPLPHKGQDAVEISHKLRKRKRLSFGKAETRSSATVKPQEYADKIVKAWLSDSDDASEESKDKKDAPPQHNGQGENKLSRKGKKLKRVSFGKVETLVCIDKRGRKRIKRSEINFTNKPSELLPQREESGEDDSETEIAEATEIPVQENNKLPKKDTKKKTKLPTKTYIGKKRNPGRPKKTKEVVHLEDPNAIVNSTAEISTDPVQGDLRSTETSSDKIDEVEKLNAEESIPERMEVHENIKSNSSDERNPSSKSRKAKIGPKSVVNRRKSNDADTNEATTTSKTVEKISENITNVDAPASSSALTVSVPVASPKSSPKRNTNHLDCTTVPTLSQINSQMAKISVNVIKICPTKKRIFLSRAHEAVKEPEEFNSTVFKSSNLKTYSPHKKRKLESAENNASAINADLSKDSDADISADGIEDAPKVNDEKLSTTINETSEGSNEDLSEESDVSKEGNESLSKEIHKDVSKEDNEDVSEGSNVSEQCQVVAKEGSEGVMAADADAQLILEISPELPNVSATNKNESPEANTCNEFMGSGNDSESGCLRDVISFQPDLEFFDVL